MATISRIKASGSLNVKLSADAFIQYNSSANAISTNFRFRYNPREGTDFFLVVNQGNNTNRFRLDPELPMMSGRTILLKYTYTFIPVRVFFHDFYCLSIEFINGKVLVTR